MEKQEVKYKIVKYQEGLYGFEAQTFNLCTQEETIKMLRNDPKWKTLVDELETITKD